MGITELETTAGLDLYPELKVPKRNCWKYNYDSWMAKPDKEAFDICNNCHKRGCTWWWDRVESLGDS